MPHLIHSASVLDERYPPLVAPEDDGLADVAEDRRDGVYQHGLELAGEIRARAAAEGRRRRPEAPADNLEALVNLVESPSTTRTPPCRTRRPDSRLGPRRSAKCWCQQWRYGGGSNSIVDGSNEDADDALGRSTPWVDRICERCRTEPGRMPSVSSTVLRYDAVNASSNSLYTIEPRNNIGSSHSFAFIAKPLR